MHILRSTVQNSTECTLLAISLTIAAHDIRRGNPPGQMLTQVPPLDIWQISVGTAQTNAPNRERQVMAVHVDQRHQRPHWLMHDRALQHLPRTPRPTTAIRQ